MTLAAAQRVATRSHVSFLAQWLIFAAALMLIASGLGYRLYQDHQRIKQEEHARLEAGVQVMKDYLGRHFVAIKHAMESVRTEFPGWSNARDGKQTAQRHLTAMTDAMLGVRTLIVTDQLGTVLHSNRAEVVGRNFQARDYFQAVSQGNKPGQLYVSPPFKTALGVWAMSISQTLSESADNFSGVIAATLDPVEFGHLLKSLRYADDMTLGLYHSNGQLFVSEPATITESASSADRIGIRQSFYPADMDVSHALELQFSRDRAAIFATWKQQAEVQTRAFALLALFLSAALLLSQRHQRKQNGLLDAQERVQAESQRILRASEDNFRQMFENMSNGAVVYDVVDDGHDFIFRQINSAVERIEKVARADLIGRRVREAFPGIEALGLLEVFQRVWRTGRAEHFPLGLYKDQRISGWRENYVYRLENGQVVAIYDDVTAQKQAEEAVKIQGENHRLTVEAIKVGAMDVDLVTEEARCDAQWYSTLGFAADAFKVNLQDWYWRIHPTDAPAARKAVAELSQTVPRFNLEFRFRDVADAWIWIGAYARVVSWKEDKPQRLIITHADITPRKQAEAVLRASEERVRALLASMQDLVFLLDTGGNFAEYYPPHGHDEFFVGGAGFFGRGFAEVLPAEIAEKVSEAIVGILTDGQPQHFEYINPTDAGVRSYSCTLSSVRGEGQYPVGFLGVVRDITERKEAEEQIRSLAFYDPLTKLPNRRLLLDRIAKALTSSHRHTRHGAILFIDLDRFKQLNDTHGHDAGDQLLIQVSHRITAQTRAVDTVARLGGDEFVVMLEELHADTMPAETEARNVAEKIRAALQQPYALASNGVDLQWECSSSIGVCLFLGMTLDRDELLRRADSAMYAAKNAGRNTIRMFVQNV